MSSDPLRDQLVKQTMEVLTRDAEMHVEVKRRLDAGEIPTYLIAAAEQTLLALSYPPNHIAGRPARDAMRAFKRHHANPRDIGASWNALKRALAYERDVSGFTYPT